MSNQSYQIVVDGLRPYPGAAKGRAAKHFGDGRASCHLMISGVDVTNAEALEPLHAFAQRIGLRREWFQPGPASAPHYDLTARKRSQAIAAGAVEIDDERAASIVEKAMEDRLGSRRRGGAQ